MDLRVPDWARPLLAVIARGEAGVEGWNRYVGRRAPAPFGDLSTRSLAQINALQLANPVPSWDAPGKTTSAIGQYQIVGKTLRGLVETLRLPTTMLFTPGLQDFLAYQLLLGRKIEAYRAGRLSLDAVMRGLKAEWASLKNPKHEAAMREALQQLRSRATATSNAAVAAATTAVPAARALLTKGGKLIEEAASAVAPLRPATPEEVEGMESFSRAR